ncbi:MBL fold metallo-hydrolase RNA specificity domain-containing protein [Sulfurimonas sp.]
MAFVQSFGAAKVVTGSAHLITFESGIKILVDFGMFQGEHEDKNSVHLDFDASEVDYLVFTHAHLDHVGRAPILFKNGFRGKIITTQSTLDLAHIVMLDSAHLMKEDYELQFRKALRRGEAHLVKQALYTPSDVDAFFSLKKIYATYEKEIQLQDEIHLTFSNAGHILGSSFVTINFLESGVKKSIVFSGDLGNKNDFVLPEPSSPTQADSLYIESTYGDRNHKDITSSIDEFKTTVIETLQRGGNVLIPSFAIERTQEILCLLKQMYYDKTLPETCKVFLDSPMAIRATRVYSAHAQELSRKCQDFMEQDGAVFDFKSLVFTQTPEESKHINNEKSGAIIIAGSGMCNGGRILHHFKHRIWDEKNAVIFVGYQAYGTLGRKIVEGAQTIHLYHEKIKIAASIHTINGFSAHADQSELLAWIEKFKKLNNIYLIHGEEKKQIIFKEVIEKETDIKTHIVEMEEKIHI